MLEELRKRLDALHRANGGLPVVSEGWRCVGKPVVNPDSKRLRFSTTAEPGEAGQSEA